MTVDIHYIGDLVSERGEVVTVLTLPADVPAGTHQLGNYFVRSSTDGSVAWVCDRVCNHTTGGTLFADSDMLAVCPRHGWKLLLDDDEGPCYDNGLPKAVLEFEQTGEKVTVRQSKQGPLQWRDVGPVRGNATARIAHLSHACLFIELGGVRIVTDPWLVGPAFHGGWWLDNPPVVAALELARTADIIYISHEHPDHLSPASLYEIDAASKHVICPMFEGEGGTRVYERLRSILGPAAKISGLQCALGEAAAYEVSASGTWFTLLRGGGHQHDSALFLANSDWGALLCVDAAAVNNFVLPQDITLMASSFAGGASGHPVMWEMPDADKKRIQLEKLGALQSLVLQHAQACRPKRFMAYAGQFSEHADLEVAEYNTKNRASYVADMVYRACGTTPFSIREYSGNQSLVLCTMEADGMVTNVDTKFSEPLYQTKAAVAAWLGYEDNDFAAAIRELAWDTERVAAYFAIKGFSPPDSLHVYIVPHTRYWQHMLNEDALTVWYLPGGHVHMRTDPAADVLQGFAARKAAGPGYGRHLLMRVRVPAMMRAVREGLPLEEIAIGFQAKFDRVGPYNATFWHAMNTKQQKA